MYITECKSYYTQLCLYHNIGLFGGQSRIWDKDVFQVNKKQTSAKSLLLFFWKYFFHVQKIKSYNVFWNKIFYLGSIKHIFWNIYGCYSVIALSIPLFFIYVITIVL